MSLFKNLFKKNNSTQDVRSSDSTPPVEYKPTAASVLSVRVSNTLSNGDYTTIARELAHFVNFSMDESKEETLEARLLAGGNAALQAISDYLILCSTGREASGWWDNSKRLVKLIRRFPSAKAENILNALISQSSSIWEYQTQVKGIAEAESRAIAAEKAPPKSET